ncbi:esterase family protein [Mucilaginibacter hurinus]|uniref:Esterase family protein n=1 Tax=Mucilaginibacter hurinus TaxID=2201324 RepID=A0A367GRQ5_9SPHI|nr:esterase family protein [Mucilaginibacter hurinus]
MRVKISTLLLFILANTAILNAASVDTASTYSAAMKKNIKAVVVKPEGYVKDKNYPVLYLLHGFGGNYANWIKSVPGIARIADQHNMLIVCPDGGFSSWYFDSPVDASFKYETYVATELVNFIDKIYATIKNRSGRAITGLSMGGHGALYLAFKHQDVFGAAGSMSGGVDIRPFPLNWNIADRLGKYSEFNKRWDEHTVINLTHLLVPGSLKIIIDCGTGDFFYNVNTALHTKLLDNNISHDFISRPGGHTWEYWADAIGYQALFFNHFFTKTK